MKGLSLVLVAFTTCIPGCGEAMHVEPAAAAQRVPQVPAKAEDCTLKGQQVTCEEFLNFGVNFYANNCTKCHDDIAMSEVAGKTLEEFDEAISTKPKMNKFSTLSEDERRAIIAALQ